jgi:hypothetical protein
VASGALACPFGKFVATAITKEDNVGFWHALSIQTNTSELKTEENMDIDDRITQEILDKYFEMEAEC